MKTMQKLHSLAALAAAAMLMAGLAACSDKDDTEEPVSPVTPVTPVSPEDYVTVPSSGTTVTRGDVAITFPSGTFDGDKQVAVTEMPAGEVLGSDEVSPFYQLVMPAANCEPISVRIRCA